MTSKTVITCDYCGEEEATPPYPHEFGRMRVDFEVGLETHARFIDLCPACLVLLIDMHLNTFGHVPGKQQLMEMSDKLKAAPDLGGA